MKKDAFYFQFGKQQPPQPLLDEIDDIILIRHLAYFQLGESALYQSMCNLDRPEKSLFLRAPLAESAGGLQRCGRAVFQDKEDKDSSREDRRLRGRAAGQLAGGESRANANDAEVVQRSVNFVWLGRSGIVRTPFEPTF